MYPNNNCYTNNCNPYWDGYKTSYDNYYKPCPPRPCPPKPCPPKPCPPKPCPPQECAPVLGSFFTSGDQIINTGVSLALTNVITLKCLMLVGNSIVIPTSGRYLVNYGVNTVPDAVAGNNIFIAVNGVAVDGTQRAVSVSAGTSGSAIIALKAGDVVTLMATATGATISGIGAPSAYINISQII